MCVTLLKSVLEVENDRIARLGRLVLTRTSGAEMLALRGERRIMP